MAIIKKFWFVRNPYRLIQQLAVVVSAFSAFYTGLCIWALASTGGVEAVSFLEGFGGLLPLPMLSIVFTILSSAVYLKLQKASATVSTELYLKLLTGWGLAVPTSLFFWQLHLLNSLKQVQGFGLVPTYLCVGVGLIYTIFVIVKRGK